MNYKLKFFSFVAACFFCSTAIAKLDKVAVIDMNKVFRESPNTSDIAKKVKQDREEIEKAFTQDSNSLKEKYQDLSKQKGIISEDALNRKTQELDNEAKNLENDFRVKTTNLMEQYKQSLNHAGLAVKDVIAEYTKKSGINLVLPEDLVAYRDESVIDITSDIIKEFSKKKLD